MVKMAWEREGARVSKMGARKKKGGHMGKGGLPPFCRSGRPHSVAHGPLCATEKAEMDHGPLIEGGAHAYSVAHEEWCATEFSISVAHGVPCATES